MKFQIQFQTREGQPVCGATVRNYTTATRAIRKAIRANATSLIAKGADGSTYDYTNWLLNRLKPCSE